MPEYDINGNPIQEASAQYDINGNPVGASSPDTFVGPRRPPASNPDPAWLNLLNKVLPDSIGPEPFERFLYGPNSVNDPRTGKDVPLNTGMESALPEAKRSLADIAPNLRGTNIPGMGNMGTILDMIKSGYNAARSMVSPAGVVGSSIPGPEAIYPKGSGINLLNAKPGPSIANRTMTRRLGSGIQPRALLPAQAGPSNEAARMISGPAGTADRTEGYFAQLNPNEVVSLNPEVAARVAGNPGQGIDLLPASQAANVGRGQINLPVRSGPMGINRPGSYAETYPYNVVPRRFEPEVSTNERVFQNLSGGVKDPTQQFIPPNNSYEGIEFVNPNNPKKLFPGNELAAEGEDAAAGIAKPSPNLTPEAEEALARKTNNPLRNPDAAARVSEREQEAYGAAAGRSDNIGTILQKVDNKEIPTTEAAKTISGRVQEVANSVGSEALSKAASEQSWLSKLFDNNIGRATQKLATTSDETRLKAISEPLARLFRRADINAAGYAGEEGFEFKNVVKALGKEKWTELQQWMDKGIVSNDPAVAAAKRAIQDRHDALLQKLDDAGVMFEVAGESKKVKPSAFIGTDYWPHMYDRSVLKSLKYGDVTDIYTKLQKEGKSIKEIDDMIKAARNWGEQKAPFQRPRDSTLPGYKTDPGVWYQHIDDLSKRLANAEEFGPMDVAGKNTEFVNLINTSKDPNQAREIVRNLLDRIESVDTDAAATVRNIKKTIGWAYLQNSAIGNLINTMPEVFAQAHISNAVKGLGQIITNYGDAAELATRAGSFQHTLASELAGYNSRMGKLYTVTYSDRVPRALASVVGRSEAKTLFDILKANPGRKIAAQKLGDLLLEDPVNVLKQSSLTEKQLKMASGRMSQMTQGLAGKLDLPQYWHSSAAVDLMTSLKKMNFAQTKNIWNIIKTNPYKAIPTLVGLHLLTGEIVGDTKALLKGTAKSIGEGKDIGEAIKEEIVNRGSIYQKKFNPLKDAPVTARLIDNLVSSWLLGIFSDAVYAMNQNSPYKTAFSNVAGPAGSLPMSYVDAFSKSKQQKSINPLLRQGIQNLPIPFGGSNLKYLVPEK